MKIEKRKSWQNRDCLYKKYWIEKLPMIKIADICNCAENTIFYWMKKFGIPRRTLSEAQKDKSQSEETKRRIKQAHIGMKASEDTRKKMREAKTGKKSNNWKGGRTIHDKGYILIWMPEHPYCNNQGYVFEHRLIMEQVLGRYLKPEEVIHHKNGIKDDNKQENLGLFESAGYHRQFHRGENVEND